ncbi:MAG: 5-formyltetrahydrofolate cyclo-ligase [Mailhella sp.]|nr:5-formyltetrahydrofolate cyclo-ligase [Mailhella sp.]
MGMETLATSEKNALRAELRARRLTLALSPEGALHSRRMQERLLESALWQKCRSVVAYISIKGEAGTERILDDAWRSGREVFLPRCRRKGEDGWPGGMDLILCGGMDELVPSPFGIPEPPLTASSCLLSDAELAEPDTLIIVPALAFDRAGFRIGYGGGYYDRMLARAACPCVGLAFHDLLFDTLPREPWDKAVQAVCTEEFLLCL